MQTADKKRIIIALDFPDERSALAMADQLDPALCRVKVGKELFTAAGPHVVRELNARDFDVFLDLKFHDIPSTVAGACRAASRLKVWMINVHASGGEAMLKAARAAVDAESHRPLLTAVTVLTSLSTAELQAVGFKDDALTTVQSLAAMTEAAGLDGVVCSAVEAPALRRRVKPAFKLVTPGIRLPEDAAGDQVRVITPQEAVANGADFLVIGRPVTGAKDPRGKLARIQQLLETT
ncbi:MAG: orotidine-5'-phosphate decarboxylase [Betaproteobacteria bacterium]|nr:orotidine-5'-phosphate decarboxylase [Betaproteobacteria bacterium]